jgi:hypothetical protein
LGDDLEHRLICTGIPKGERARRVAFLRTKSSAIHALGLRFQHLKCAPAEDRGQAGRPKAREGAAPDVVGAHHPLLGAVSI